MLRTLLMTAIFISPLAEAADKASDLSPTRPMATRMAEADDAVVAMEMWADALGGFYGHALYEGNADRLSCLTGKEATVRNLVAASVTARYELRPAMLDGRHAKVEREMRKVRIARDRAYTAYAAGVECSHLVEQPIEPGPQRSWNTTVDDDLAPMKRSAALQELNSNRW